MKSIPAKKMREIINRIGWTPTQWNKYTGVSRATIYTIKYSLDAHYVQDSTVKKIKDGLKKHGYSFDDLLKGDIKETKNREVKMYEVIVDKPDYVHYKIGERQYRSWKTKNLEEVLTIDNDGKERWEIIPSSS